MERGFDHADATVWPTPRLIQRLADISIHQSKMQHSQSRQKQMHNEFESGVFEIVERWTEDLAALECQPND